MTALASGNPTRNAPDPRIAYECDTILCRCGHVSASHGYAAQPDPEVTGIGKGACGIEYPLGMLGVEPPLVPDETASDGFVRAWTRADLAYGTERCRCDRLDPVDPDDAKAKSWPGQSSTRMRADHYRALGQVDPHHLLPSERALERGRGAASAHQST